MVKHQIDIDDDVLHPDRGLLHEDTMKATAHRREGLALPLPLP